MLHVKQNKIFIIFLQYNAFYCNKISKPPCIISEVPVWRTGTWLEKNNASTNDWTVVNKNLSVLSELLRVKIKLDSFNKFTYLRMIIIDAMVCM